MFTCVCSYFYMYVFMCENKDDNDLLEVVPAILLRFRENKIDIAADIRKASQRI